MSPRRSHGMRVIVAVIVVTVLVTALIQVGDSPLARASAGFVVNSTADNNVSDNELTLREAILVANGATGVGGLGRPASAAEQVQLGGCTFSGGLVIGGCGTSVADLISFAFSDGTIALNTPLPPLLDPGTTIIGPVSAASEIVIDASALPGGS